MKRFVNWSWEGKTVSDKQAERLVKMADKEEYSRATGLSDKPFQFGVEARYFPFGDIGVIKNYKPAFEKRANEINQINPRLSWLLEQGDRVPFIFGIAEYDTHVDKVYKHEKTDYVFISKVEGEQVFDHHQLNTMRGFGIGIDKRKWNDLLPEEQSAIINYMTKAIKLLGTVSQDDCNKVIKSIIKIYFQELASDVFIQNMLYSQDACPKFGFCDLRSMGNNPDISLQCLIDALKNDSIEIHRTLEKHLPRECRESLEHDAQSFSKKIVIADKENEKLKAFVIKKCDEKPFYWGDQNNVEEVRKRHNYEIEKLL